MSTFFDLYPDILLKIFKYFSLNELFDIFTDIIPYLSTLLIEGHVKLYIDKNANNHFWNDFLREINQNQIISLYIPYSKINDINLLQFSSLRSIILEDFQMINSLSLYPINVFHNFIYLERLSLKLSYTILNENLWLDHILHLSTVKQLKIDLMFKKNTILSQRDIKISHLPLQSSTIKYLEIKIPLLWTSILSLLHHFPFLQTFHAYLYRINFNSNDTLQSKPTLTCFNSLKTLHLTGYFSNMSSIINFFCSSILHLQTCQLMSTSVTNDNIFNIINFDNYFFWLNYLFQSCQYLTKIKIHMLMSIESHKNIDIENLKDLIHLFNNNQLCKQYNLYIIQSSIHNGYITLIGNFNKRTKKLR